MQKDSSHLAKPQKYLSNQWSTLNANKKIVNLQIPTSKIYLWRIDKRYRSLRGVGFQVYGLMLYVC